MGGPGKSFIYLILLSFYVILLLDAIVIAHWSGAGTNTLAVQDV